MDPNQPALPPPPDMLKGWREMGEGAGGFVARMHFVTECVKLWRKSWKKANPLKRVQFADAVLEYAIQHLEGFAVQIVSTWLQEPGVWERLEKLISDERRQAFAQAVLDQAQDALQDRDWQGRSLVQQAAEAAAERELAELGRRQAVNAMAGGSDDAAQE